MTKITIAVDAMGGDHGPSVTVPACLTILNKHPDLELILVGDQRILEGLIKNKSSKLRKRLSIQHASQQVAMDEKPSVALRTKKDSSMRIALNLIKEQKAQACVSAGNTGALMATARFVLKTLPGIDRPAIMASFPTGRKDKEVRVLDLGANVDSCADHLYQFAIMGSVAAKAVNGIKNPTVGLLNIGEEEIKGNDLVKHTSALLSESESINYYGYVEGDDIYQGTVDVIVCDGFVGNVALKTSEGLLKLIARYAKEEFRRNWFTLFMAMIASPVLRGLSQRLDPGQRNGASFIGLQGIVIKSHGSADRHAFANAIVGAIQAVDKDIPNRIRHEVGEILED